MMILLVLLKLILLMLVVILLVLVVLQMVLIIMQFMILMISIAIPVCHYYLYTCLFLSPHDLTIVELSVHEGNEGQRDGVFVI